MPDTDERQQQILDAAAAVIIRLGYDKTTMSDIADEAGVSRGTVYLYFKGKEELFEALLFREWTLYSRTWLEHVEADPRGATIGGYCRALFHAISSRPLIASVMRRDRRVIGSYLRKPDNRFASMMSPSVTLNFVRMLQEAGTVRPDVDPVVMAHIIDIVSVGQLTIGDFMPDEEYPPYDAVMAAIADMMDHLMTPPDGGDDEAGKAMIRRIVAGAYELLGQETGRQGTAQPTEDD